MSAFVIAKDEERHLGGTLASLRGLADEVVVLIDSATTDRTADVARRFGAKIAFRRFEDFSSQKQAALELTTGYWALSLDADERLSPELQAEIAAVLDNPKAIAGYELPRAVFFMGKRLRWGGLGSERVLRLVRRELARYDAALVHESLRVKGRVGRLRGAILHEPYESLGEYLEKLRLYSELDRRQLTGPAVPMPWWGFALPFWELFSRGVLRLGFLDGRAGLTWATLSAFQRWFKYAYRASPVRKAPAEESKVVDVRL